MYTSSRQTIFGQGTEGNVSLFRCWMFHCVRSGLLDYVFWKLKTAACSVKTLEGKTLKCSIQIRETVESGDTFVWACTQSYLICWGKKTVVHSAFRCLPLTIYEHSVQMYYVLKEIDFQQIWDRRHKSHTNTINAKKLKSVQKRKE